MLEHAQPITVLGDFGTQREMPANATDTLVFRRTLPLGASLTGTNIQNGGPAGDLLHQGRHPSRLVGIEQAQHPAADAHLQSARQGPDPAGVLGGHHVGGGQRIGQAPGGVGRLTQWRRTQEQTADGHARSLTMRVLRLSR